MLYLRSRVTRYVLLFEGRTGSSYLTTSLDSHPKVHALEEALVRLKKEGHEAQERWIRKALTPPLIGRWGSIGFKTKLRDISDPARFSALLKELDVKIIHMQRKNRVKVTVSEINCNILHQKTNYYNIYKEEDRLAPVSIDVEQFKRVLKMREDLDSQLKHFVEELRLPTLELYYEDILRDEADVLHRTYNFLGVPPILTKGTSFKNTSDNLREALLNFDELRAEFIGTPYENMFDEVIAPPSNTRRG